MKTQPRPQNKKKAAPTKKAVQPNAVKKSSKSTTTPIHMRVFYAFMLFLMASGSFMTILGRRNVTQARALSTPTPLVAVGNGLSAKALTLHRQGGATSVCDDLVVTVTGDAVLAGCSNGVEQQYRLSDTERQQLTTWLDTLQSINYDSTASSQAGALDSRLYLNAHGTKVVTQADRQAVLAFASALDAEIASKH